MTMIDDPIVEELRAHRKAFAEAHGNDLMQIAEALRLREMAADVPRVRFAPKLAENAVAALREAAHLSGKRHRNKSSAT